MSFQNLGLCEPVLRAVLMEGYSTPTPIQLQAIPQILEGRDVLGCAQTGTGKTAAFALPILHQLLDQAPAKGAGRQIRVLVLASTRELALQIRESFATYGAYTSLRSTVVYGGVSQASQVRDLRHGVDILIATPGRLLDLMEQGYIDLRRVETLVLDEADRMLDMGFLPAIRQIVGHLPRQRQTLLFSATMPDPIAELASSILRQPLRITIEPAQKATELVDQRVCFVPAKEKATVLATMLGEFATERVLIFTRTKHGADRVAKQLTKMGFPSDALHSNKSQNARQRILENFKSKRAPILVATDIAARGIDVDGISHVFNVDLPNEPETYVHRIGRTGRAGATGMAISLCDGSELKFLRDIERLLGKKVPVGFTMAGYDRQVLSDSRSPVGFRSRRKPGADPRRTSGPRTGVSYAQSDPSVTSSEPKTQSATRPSRKVAKRRLRRKPVAG